MQRISTASAVTDLFGPGKPGFTDGDPVGGIPTTWLNAAWFNMLQEEVARAIELAGIALDPAHRDQLYDAIGRIAKDTVDNRTRPVVGLTRIPFLPVSSLQVSVPPAGPGIGALYVVGAAPTGAWTGQSGKIAEYFGGGPTGGWRFQGAQDGTVVYALDQSVFYQQKSGAWQSLLANETEQGVTYIAGKAETIAMAILNKSVCPGYLPFAIDERVKGLATQSLLFPHVNRLDGLVDITTAASQITLQATISFTWRGLVRFSLADYVALHGGAALTFAGLAAGAYHLRWYPPGSAAAPLPAWPQGRWMLRSVADAAYNPSALAEASALLDTTHDDWLAARVVVGGAGAVTVTRFLTRGTYLTSSSLAVPVTDPGANGAFVGSATYVLNWGLTPNFVVACSDVRHDAAGIGTGMARVYTASANRYGLTVDVARFDRITGNPVFALMAGKKLMRALIQDEYVIAILPEDAHRDLGIDLPGWTIGLDPPAILDRARVAEGAIVDVLALATIHVDAGGRRHATPGEGRQPVACGWADAIARGTGGQWHVVDPIDLAKAETNVAIGVEAERQRQRWITPGSGQAMTYARKVDEARAVQGDLDPQPADYPMLAASLGIDGDTLPAVAATILGMDARWQVIGAAIEARRLRLKREVAGAGDAVQLAVIDITAGWPDTL